MVNIKLKQKIDSLPANAKILDVGGWFKPCSLATHVVDLMPWETRGAKLQLEPLPDERFTKETWYQLNFLNPKLELPFADKEFDFSICSHTLEDLESPHYLIPEILRVSKAGYIEVPSRLHEQTIGVRDRASSLVGHPHHYWIIDKEENTLFFYNKSDSLAGSHSFYTIPLQIYEKQVRKATSNLAVLEFFWDERLDIKFQNQKIAELKAREFRNSLAINLKEVWQDKLIRSGRRFRDGIFKKSQQKTESWWQEIVTLSQPYSSIKLG
ncbi:class I SAM-dependent methyltransferase [Trichocoleus sp. ST-U3]